MKTIYKYLLDAELGEPTIEVVMPVGAIIRHVGNAPGNGKPRLWAEIDTDELSCEARFFVLLPTGGAIVGGAEYVGTIEDFIYMWHVYEIKEEEQVDG